MSSDLVRPGYQQGYVAILGEKLVAVCPTSPAEAAAAIVSVTGGRIFHAPGFLAALADALAVHSRPDLAELVCQIDEATLREASATETRATVRLWPRSAGLESARRQALRRATLDLRLACRLRGEYVPVPRISSPARPRRREPRARRTVRTSRGDPEPSKPPPPRKTVARRLV